MTRCNTRYVGLADGLDRWTLKWPGVGGAGDLRLTRASPRAVWDMCQSLSQCTVWSWSHFASLQLVAFFTSPTSLVCQSTRSLLHHRSGHCIFGFPRDFCTTTSLSFAQGRLDNSAIFSVVKLCPIRELVASLRCRSAAGESLQADRTAIEQEGRDTNFVLCEISVRASDAECFLCTLGPDFNLWTTFGDARRAAVGVGSLISGPLVGNPASRSECHPSSTPRRGAARRPCSLWTAAGACAPVL
jgi:hypothetical protein